MSATHKYDPYADLLLEILNPADAGFIAAMNLQEIQRHINDLAAKIGEPKVPAAESVIAYIRKVLGGEVLPYDRRSGLYVVTDNPELAHWYANKRRDLALSHVKSAHKIAEDIATKFPSYKANIEALRSTLGALIMMVEGHKAVIPDIDVNPIDPATGEPKAV